MFTKFRRVRVQMNAFGILTGVGGSLFMVHTMYSDPSEVTWAAAIWAVSMFGMAVCSLISSWMGKREVRDVNQYRAEIASLTERINKLEQG